MSNFFFNYDYIWSEGSLPDIVILHSRVSLSFKQLKQCHICDNFYVFCFRDAQFCKICLLYDSTEICTSVQKCFRGTACKKLNCTHFLWGICISKHFIWYPDMKLTKTFVNHSLPLLITVKTKVCFVTLGNPQLPISWGRMSWDYVAAANWYFWTNQQPGKSSVRMGRCTCTGWAVEAYPSFISVCLFYRQDMASWILWYRVLCMTSDT